MTTLLALAVCATFLVLAGWHFYMAFLPLAGESGAVPSVGGKPVFVPTMRATIGVGLVLTAFAGLVATTAGFLPIPLPGLLLTWLMYGLALGLLARAIGEFRYVGFFKRVRGSRFARLDTWVYSPLCLLLAAGVALVGLHRAA
ncbi:MAG: hypothetical protein AVDCRST_MAG51-1923 [uncultured Ramlibacter sp.]|uniref:DUF3995 domain-containing protein n=1 Tax=uncultured Ramlibacter sp. TaxID=260755 RepID=A0A6J4PNI0_9BURK|nr:MAG: hypothetical protein AVDCRST_MAG51-1923 [uncultured Ramlibacter sp.]